jgi:hypothetical protein
MTTRFCAAALASALLAVPCWGGWGSSAEAGGERRPGNTLPGDWRPFSDDSPWNTPIPADAVPHPDSALVLRTLEHEAASLRLANSYTIPVWVVNSDELPQHHAVSPYPFDTWDQDLDGVTEATVPVAAGMYAEATRDGHIAIIDLFKGMSWEMSRYQGLLKGRVRCTTFNIWDLTGPGVGDGNEGVRWTARGGRGSGFPIVAGLIRPEALSAGEIRHALVFTFPKNRKRVFVAPASRTDGRWVGSEYPLEGMRLQLDPTLTNADFDAWGLTREARVVARALQHYGMFDGDNGGAMALQPQLLGPTPREHRARWESLAPGFYDSVQRIPTRHFRVVDTGPPMMGGRRTTVVAPLVLPLGTRSGAPTTVTISTPTAGASITYTLDGSTPRLSSPSYSGPIAIAGPTALRARAFHPAMKASGVTRALFGRAARVAGE